MMNAQTLIRISCVPAAFCLLAAMTLLAAPRAEAQSTSYWLDKIMMCESGGDPFAENLSETETHWDGRVGSFGLFQFGEGTWEDVAERLFAKGLMDIDWSKVPPHYAPPEVQRRIAYFTWDSGSGWEHWYNCSHNVGYVDTIELPEDDGELA